MERQKDNRKCPNTNVKISEREREREREHDIFQNHRKYQRERFHRELFVRCDDLSAGSVYSVMEVITDVCKLIITLFSLLPHNSTAPLYLQNNTDPAGTQH